MGPTLTFDKSFLEMLRPDEIDELDRHFMIFMTPILVSEIQADLKHPAPRNGKLPEDLVKALARKMVSNHGVMQMHFRPLALGEISGRIRTPVHMRGQILLDSTAPNVMGTRDGRGVIYDENDDTRMWADWAAGHFTAADEYLAARWREHAAQISLEEIGTYWVDFCRDHLPGVHTIERVIAGVDDLISQSAEQSHFLTMVLHFTEAPAWATFPSVPLMQAGLLPSLKRWSPYASYVARLSMIFCCCSTLGLLTARPTNVLDLQYLFYAPFSQIFVSHDHLHRVLWPAVEGGSIFLWGAELKQDLRRYADARQDAGARRADGIQAPHYTSAFTPENSVIARARASLGFGSHYDPTKSGPTGHISALPPAIREDIEEAMRVIDARELGPPHGR